MRIERNKNTINKKMPLHAIETHLRYVGIWLLILVMCLTTKKKEKLYDNYLVYTATTRRPKTNALRGLRGGELNLLILDLKE